MESIEEPLRNAFDAHVLLVEWVENIWVSMPAKYRKELIHLAMVLFETARCGLFRLIHRLRHDDHFYE